MRPLPVETPARSAHLSTRPVYIPTSTDPRSDTAGHVPGRATYQWCTGEVYIQGGIPPRGT